jgi:hypothetical protein
MKNTNDGATTQVDKGKIESWGYNVCFSEVETEVQMGEYVCTDGTN